MRNNITMIFCQNIFICSTVTYRHIISFRFHKFIKLYQTLFKFATYWQMPFFFFLLQKIPGSVVLKFMNQVRKIDIQQYQFKTIKYNFKMNRLYKNLYCRNSPLIQQCHKPYFQLTPKIMFMRAYDFAYNGTIAFNNTKGTILEGCSLFFNLYCYLIRLCSKQQPRGEQLSNSALPNFTLISSLYILYQKLSVGLGNGTKNLQSLYKYLNRKILTELQISFKT
eukprot:TRINITY_DN3601_c0_g1_i1.p2 TRINITY_DN3601_c0_g1~~TRINITY_DN3601_c0_g1_i1.p2  ORF type:complete len:223 (+),score=-20.20 TRINITY_DN3601_c0_g1_i1:1431-2099(+)